MKIDKVTWELCEVHYPKGSHALRFIGEDTEHAVVILPKDSISRLGERGSLIKCLGNPDDYILNKKGNIKMYYKDKVSSIEYDLMLAMLLLN